MFGPVHQGGQLLLPGELELGLDVGLRSDPELVKLQLVAASLGLQDTLGRHVARPEVAVLSVDVVPGALVALRSLSLLLHGVSLHPDGHTFVVSEVK